MLDTTGTDGMPAADLEIIGAGFGRTGTTSLKEALRILGYRKCYHMTDVYRNGHADLWRKKANGGDLDWEEVLGGYRAAVDWPVASYYEELAELNPNAKVLLTVRDADSWYRSIMSTLYAYYKLIPFWRRWVNPKIRTRVEGMEQLIWNGVFHGRVEDAEYAKNLYLQHNADVQRKLPADRLLVVNLSDGWKPLCDFLDKPVPEDTPFPYVNQGASTKRKLRRLRIEKYASYALIPALLLLLYFVSTI